MTFALAFAVMVDGPIMSSPMMRWWARTAWTVTTVGDVPGGEHVTVTVPGLTSGLASMTRVLVAAGVPGNWAA
jgi:hypothetical protein